VKTLTFCLALIVMSCILSYGQTYKVLYSFAGSESGDGAEPLSSLALDHAGNLYGTTFAGGLPVCGHCGTVFELSPNSDGSGRKKSSTISVQTSSTIGARTDPIPRLGSFLILPVIFTARVSAAALADALPLVGVVERFTSCPLPPRMEATGLSQCFITSARMRLMDNASMALNRLAS
jgi:uncharacterized repeat protein (TIGR03803 family)